MRIRWSLSGKQRLWLTSTSSKLRIDEIRKSLSCDSSASKWTHAFVTMCRTRQTRSTVSPSLLLPVTRWTSTTRMDQGDVDRRRQCSSHLPKQRFLSTMSGSHHVEEKASAHSVTVNENGSAVTVHFAHHHHHGVMLSPISVFHASWLWLNDPSFVHETSGQRTRPSATTFYGHCIRHAEIVSAKEVPANKTTKNSGNLQIPIPPPTTDCLHPIGSVYQTSHDTEKCNNDNSNGNSNNSFLLKIVWGRQDSNETSESFYDLNWLWRCRYDDSALEYRQGQTQVTKQTALRRDSQVVRINHNLTLQETTMRDAALFDILDAIVKDGAVIVDNAPTWQDYLSSDDNNIEQQQQEETVGRLGRALAGGSLSHGSLYGDIFHVQSIPDAHNIAYTNQALPPHQDLSYFESKPGLQLLHCLANDTSIVGGESTLIDAMAAATELKQLAPHLYQVLVQTEATFVKQRHNADMVARRPHIVQDSSGCVVQVSWSPPFEGPACVPPHIMEDYILAHAALTRMLDKSLPRDQLMLSTPRGLLDPAIERDLMDYAHEYTWTKRLEPGEILIFNNQRMLHGRAAFEYAPSLGGSQDKSAGGGADGGGRHLIGCYTNLDDTLSQYRILRRHFGKKSLSSSASSSSSALSIPSFIRNLGNGFSGGI